ncbi:MAG: N-acetyl-alpha-D-glucosaminyl L-malate synthase BshA [Gemmatimonadota bacterium]|nr:N-acetyl-alpha-D-glucosaminyl L-malate synthase BshA [Gemmatimonadota bacterium]
MKIGITCYPTYGGSGAVATALGLALAERGHEIHFITYDQPFRLPGFKERVFYHEVEMEDYPLFEHPPYSLALAVALHDAVKREGLDLVHMHYAIPHAASAFLAREMLGEGRDLKIVTTLHGTDITLLGLHPSFHEITRFSILQSDGLSAVSSFLRDETVCNFSVPRDRIEVIPNFLDTDLWRPEPDLNRLSMLAPHGEKVVMHVSNFRPVKQVHHVVEIFAKISQATSARLVLIGDGPERPRALQRARDLGLDDKVLFLGKHVAVEELLACANLFLLPSASESFGLAALEAMACGVPVVASTAGGIPELVQNNVSGYLFPSDAIDEMAEAGIRILTDEALEERLSLGGREATTRRFDKEIVIPEYEALYESVTSST